MQKHLAPILASRIALCAKTEKTDPKEPQDQLQMMIRYAMDHCPHELVSLKTMTRRVAMANLGAFHQTSIAITNIIFNILGSDEEFNTIAVLREEIASLVPKDGKWTKSLLNKLVKCDSVIKESLRATPFGNRGLMRAVMVDDLTTPDGIRLPKGGMVSLLVMAQNDEDVFPNPWKFSPFRYSDLREKEGSNASFVSLGDRFLPFGYGRHSCPGRFLLDFELKQVLAYLLGNYEVQLAVEHAGVRPESKWVAEATMPPSKGKIRVKRRKV
jgi:cytochrome P450